MRVWITGVGAVSPLATGAAATFRRLLAGDRALVPLTLFDGSAWRCRTVGQVDGLVVPSHASRADALALLAAREALAHAGAIDGPIDLVVAGSTGGMFDSEPLLAAAELRPDPRLTTHPLSATAALLGREASAFRRTRTLCSACSSGANALVLGAAWIRAGRATHVLAGGVDTLCRTTLAGFNALSACDPEPCRPFDATRAGLNLGEGAAFVVLERDDVATARGATPIAELAGWAVGSEAHHITQPQESGTVATALILRAMERAQLPASQLGYVNAHGTATLHNDRMEARALHAALGPDVARVAVSSSKGQLGHLLGAAGAMEAVITALAVAEGSLPPTGGLERPDPACELDLVIGGARRRDLTAALSSSFGFGGGDTVLALARPGVLPAAGPVRRAVFVTSAASLDGKPSAAPLEPARARRMDSLGAGVTAAAARVLGDRRGAGLVTGSAFGNAQLCTAFLRRLPHANPLEFPNTVPSSPAAHASIYLGLEGPVLSVAALAASGDAALRTAIDLVEAGEADAMIAAAAAERDVVIEQAIAPSCLPRPAFGEGAVAVRFSAAGPGVRVVWSGEGDEQPPPPSGRRVELRAEAGHFDLSAGLGMQAALAALDDADEVLLQCAGARFLLGRSAL